MKYYSINEVAMMTGFTTRTLRTYLHSGILDGEKIGGIWQFSAEDLAHFLLDPNIISGIKSKTNAQALDFLANDTKNESQICAVFDFYADDEESAEISEFFCDQMNASQKSGAKFSLLKVGRNTRVTLTGPEDIISEMICLYYSNSKPPKQA